MAELVDALASGASGRKAVEVRVFSWAPTLQGSAMTVELHRGDLPPDIDFGASVAVDTETQGLNPLRDRLCLMQLSAGDGSAHLVQFERGAYDAPVLKQLLASPDITKIFHFARFDLATISRYLGIIEARVRSEQTGANWQRQFCKLHGRDMTLLTGTYYRNQQANRPVHEWDFETYTDV